jgi:hypothetical protein
VEGEWAAQGLGQVGRSGDLAQCAGRAPFFFLHFLLCFSFLFLNSNFKFNFFVANLYSDQICNLNILVWDESIIYKFIFALCSIFPLTFLYTISNFLIWALLYFH